MAPRQFPCGSCQGSGRARTQAPSARGRCCLGTLMLLRPLRASWSAVRPRAGLPANQRDLLLPESASAGP
eukprot:1943444-Pyramimonas_sp.AAC.1